MIWIFQSHLACQILRRLTSAKFTRLWRRLETLGVSMTVSSCFPQSWCQSTPRRCFRESYSVSFPSKANQIRRVERKWKKGVQFTSHLLRLSSRIASCLPTNQSESKDGRTRGSSVFASASAFASVSAACSCKRRQSSALIKNWTYVLL